MPSPPPRETPNKYCLHSVSRCLVYSAARVWCRDIAVQTACGGNAHGRTLRKRRRQSKPFHIRDQTFECTPVHQYTPSAVSAYVDTKSLTRRASERGCKGGRGGGGGGGGGALVGPFPPPHHPPTTATPPPPPPPGFSISVQLSETLSILEHFRTWKGWGYCVIV